MPGETATEAIDHAMNGDHAALATAYLCRSASELSRMAGLIGRPSEAERYGELAEGARDAWQREFVADDGSVTAETQADLVRALAFELVPAELRERTSTRG